MVMVMVMAMAMAMAMALRRSTRGENAPQDKLKNGKNF